jgi:hypothetical protein
MLPIVTALTDFLANWLYRGQCPPRRRRILHRFGPSRIQVFRFRVYADLSRSPACFPLLRPLLTSHGISSLGSPQVRTRCFRAQPLHLPRRRNLWVSLCGASSPGRIGLLCSSGSSAHRFRLAFLPPSVTLPELASTGDLISCFLLSQGSFTPFATRPCWRTPSVELTRQSRIAHARRCRYRTTGGPI